MQLLVDMTMLFLSVTPCVQKSAQWLRHPEFKFVIRLSKALAENITLVTIEL